MSEPEQPAPDVNEVLERRAAAIYGLAYRKVAAMLAVYQVRGLEPGEYVQQLPTFPKEADWRLALESGSFDDAVASFTYDEWLAYLECMRVILKTEGYETKDVPITQMKFLKYVHDMESSQ